MTAELTTPTGETFVGVGDQNAVDELRAIFAREAKRDPQSIKARFWINGQISARDAIKELARTFPSIADLQMFAPDAHFDGAVMDKFRGGLCHGGKCALQFIGSVWNPSEKRKCGKFDLHEALGVWDEEHRAAFTAWASDPWWP
jgi:hypothetical protein